MRIISTGNARRAVTAGLGLSLAIAAAFGATPATAETGTITITQQSNEGARYDAFMLFSADIDQNDRAKRVGWADEETKAAVLGFIDGETYGEWLAERHPGEGQHDRAQVAAEYVAEMIGASATDEVAATTPRTVAARTFASRLAQAVAGSGVGHELASAGTAFEGDEGFWLFVTTDDTTEDNGEAGTAPIWVPLGGTASSILEKSATPTIDKEVREDSTGEWGKVADANTSQDLDYRLTGTLPSNFGAFDLYHYKFTDTLEDGLAIDATPETIADAITVSIDGEEVAVDGEELKATYEGNVLTVEFADLKSGHWEGLGITAASVVTVEYPCHMNEGRNIGAAGNLNGAYLTYTDDPVWLGDGRTDEVDVRVFAYKVSLRKVDEQTDEPIAGAGFTIAAGGDGDPTLYVQQDGSLAATPHEFVTGDDGTFEVMGLDEGTYVLSEVTVPEGWNAIDDDIALAVTSELEGESLSLVGLAATVTGGTEAHEGAASVTGVDAVDGDAGLVTVNATDARWLGMPATGLGGLGPAAALGSALAVGSGAVLAVRRRRS